MRPIAWIMRHSPAMAVLCSLILTSPLGAQPSVESAPRTVKLVTVSSTPSVSSRRFIGRLEAVSTVDMAFQVGGRIARMPVREGQLLREGELIAQLDRRDYELALEEAEIALEQAQTDFQRNQPLIEQGAIAEARFDRANTELQARRVAVESARRDLAQTRLEAPFEALVTRRLVEPHTVVQAGTQVVRVQDVSELRVRIAVPEDLIGMLESPDELEATLTLSAWPGREFELGYREHATEADPVAQTYTVRLGMSRPEELPVLPGMTGTVTVRMPSAQQKTTIEVPMTALDTAEDGSFRVWVYDGESGQVSPRAVETGEPGGDRVAIRDGLAGGERIVAAGAHRLHAGMRVTPFESRQD